MANKTKDTFVTSEFSYDSLTSIDDLPSFDIDFESVFDDIPAYKKSLKKEKEKPYFLPFEEHNSHALCLIQFLQRIQFRDISASNISKEVSKFPYPSTLKKLLTLMYRGDIPHYTEFESCHDPYFLLSKFSITSSFDKIDINYRTIIKIIASELPKKEKYFKCMEYLSNVLLQEEEAKFYSDLFSGGKFGLSRSFVKNYLQIEECKVKETLWPEVVYGRKIKSFPVYGEVIPEGYKLKFIKNNDDIFILDVGSGNDVTNSFPFLLTTSSLLPKTCSLDLLFSFNTLTQKSHSKKKLDQGDVIDLDLDEEQKDGKLFILDFTWPNDKKVYSDRRKRLKKFKERTSHLFQVNIVNSKVLNSKQEISKFLEKSFAKNDICFIREDTSYSLVKPSIFGYFKPHTREIVTLSDYAYRQYSMGNLDYLIATTSDKKTLMIKNYGSCSSWISHVIPNRVGSTGWVVWREIEGSGLEPVLTSINQW